MTSHNDIDRAIDDVARAMTAGDPHASLRARVLAQVEAQRPFAWRPVFASVCVGGAIVALLFAMSRTTLRNPPSTLVTQSSTLRQPPSTLGNPPSTLRDSPSTLGKSLRSTLRHSPNPFAEPFEEEDPISVTPITVAPIAPTELTGAEQLPSIAPISVAPLDEQGESK